MIIDKKRRVLKPVSFMNREIYTNIYNWIYKNKQFYTLEISHWAEHGCIINNWAEHNLKYSPALGATACPDIGGFCLFFCFVANKEIYIMYFYVLSMKHGSNQLTLTILFHLWHLLVIQSCTLLVSLVKVVVLLSFFDHTWNSNFSALATYLHLNLSNSWLLNFQLATRKLSFLTSIVLHLPKYLLFFRNSRTYSKFLFHHHLSSSSVVTSIFMLTLI